MKVLHVIHTLDPASGGPPSVAVSLAAAQARLGHDVCLAHYGADHVECGGAYGRIPCLDKVGHNVMSPLGRWERWTAHCAQRELRRIVPAFDVVHLHEMWHPLVAAAAAVARKQGVPYVVTPHGMLDPWCLRQKALKKRAALALGWRKVLDRAAFLHVLNADEGRLLEPLRLASRVETFPNGIFLDETAAAEKQDRSAPAPARPGNRTVLFLGRLHYKKGLDYLAAAFAILRRSVPDAQLVVAGPDEGAREGFLREVERYGLTENVCLPGPLYGERKRAALRGAACFCLPSRQEGFSVAVLEAMASRLPVVISEACHFPEVAQYGAGRVVPLEPEQIAAGLCQVLQDRGAAERMGRAGFELVQSRYTWSQIATHMTAAYARAAATA